MNDRVSLYPGRVKLTPVSGQENTYDMVRADEPTQEGDPLNQNTLLKDATAALYGKDENALPDEIFAIIHSCLNEKISMDLLWENATPTSAFSGQTISMDLSAYTVFVVETKNPSVTCHVAIKGKSTKMQDNDCPSSSMTVGYTRGIEFSDSGVSIGGGANSIYGAGNNLRYSDSYLIPQRIYGIKGVSA